MNRKDFEAKIAAQATQDADFRKALLANPRATLTKALGEVREGATIPENVEVVVLEESANKIYVVIPAAPSGNLSESDLAGISGGAGSQNAVAVAVANVGGPTILDNGVVIAVVGGGPPPGAVNVMLAG